jgi:acetolactate synthase-1/2/3 large subunit
MNGAQTLIDTLADAGVEVCFANPGTSEMQLVAAIDQQPRMRGILCLFEGVVTGAADGYGRMADKPALTLLHLGPGYGNGTANLHNARRAFSPVLNMVGDHATYHLQYDAPLTADIEGFAEPVSAWIGVSQSAEDLAATGLAAMGEAMRYPGRVTTFIVPADHAWNETSAPEISLQIPEAPQADEDSVSAAAQALQADGESVLFLGGRALRADALEQAGRIAAATGARLVTETFCARLQRGAGRIPVERLPYFGEQASEFLQHAKQLVFVGTKPPVSFFAYPNKPSWLSPEDATLIELADPTVDALDALSRLADALEAPAEPATRQPRLQHDLESGPINQLEMGKIIANRLPENAIVSDEGATNSLGAFLMTAGAAAHDWLMLTGGAIGQGLPVAIGAAVACPERKVLSLQADGSAMYTVQSLWTMMREQLDVTVLLLNNNSYAILNIELARVGVENPGPTALSLLDLSNPEINWCDIASGMGLPAERVTTVEALDAAFARAMENKGPQLIEVMV